MKYLHQILQSPELNLALDEALLNWAEDGHSPEGILRTWESPTYFVVLGFSNKAESEVHIPNCLNENIPILRRFSGGGTVLQGPGCLNYQLVLPIHSHPQLATVTQTNQFIMHRIAQALNHDFGPHHNVQVKGTTDLVYNHKKFSGNAQRRKRHFIAFHGTFLYKFQLPLIARFLSHPSISPTYRENKSHLDFITNFPASSHQIISSLTSTWNAHSSIGDLHSQLLLTHADSLATSKYSTPTWTNRL